MDQHEDQQSHVAKLLSQGVRASTAWLIAMALEQEQKKEILDTSQAAAEPVGAQKLWSQNWGGMMTWPARLAKKISASVLHYNN